MITNAFLSIFFFLLVGLLAVLPAGSPLPSQIDSAIDFFTPYWNAWSDVFPLAQLLIILSAVLIMEFSILTFKSINWVLKKVRGSG